MSAGLPRSGPSPGSRLELWLVKTIRRGRLKGYPRYYPPRGTVGHNPEQYALRLLGRLRIAQGHPREIERVKDDGRAFRSWAETAQVRSEPGTKTP
jgi:hypothetical protein